MSEEIASHVAVDNEKTQAVSSEKEGLQAEAESLPADMFYKCEDLHSRPSITPNSDIPENLLHFSHSFGYDSGRRANLQLLDNRTLIFVAGNLLVLLDLSTNEQRYLRSCSGGGIGSVTVHPSNNYFAVAEKGNRPNIVVYEHPSLRPYRILRGGTEQVYTFVEFNRDGSLLASVGSAPDYMLTLWEWRQEEVLQKCMAVSQEVYKVTFSPYSAGLLTSSGSGHIKFWKMASTFTGPKLQGLIGHFGKTAATDIEGFVQLPDGKVVSGSEWGNLLLWDGNAIKVEICREGGRGCHMGTVQPFALEDGQLLTFGSDGVVRGWDFDSIDTADSDGNNSRFEIEPRNEMVVGHKVCLSSMVKSSVPDSFIWFAQDSNGAIWKLDLSFSHTTPDPECLFSFHAGAIWGLDVSWKSHLMATTALDRSVKVFDLLDKREVTSSRFNQGGTTLQWAPPSVSQSGGLLVIGFEDGVVRLLELYAQRLPNMNRHSPKGEATLRLKQAVKPHNAPVTAVAYERNGEILATGSSDGTVFFFTVGEKYNPIGFVCVPGPVQALEWSPHSHNENRLLIMCQSGHMVEVHRPDPEAQKQTETFQLCDLPSRFFKFKSIKSRIKRDEEIARRQALRERRQRAREEGLTVLQQPAEQEEDEEEELPPIYIPDIPSPLCCGFYSELGQFWLSMGGFDSGFLYHCRFSEKQVENPDQRQDEPFDFLPVHNADENPICSVTFSSNRQLLLCGMHSGSIRVYPLQPGDLCLTSMQAYWELSAHDNHYGHLRHICCSHDDRFVLTAGDDGNIFSFCLLPPDELQKGLQRKRAEVPSPRVGLENEILAQDIEDSSAYSLETAQQRLEKDRLRREAEGKRKRLAELQKKFKHLLNENQNLPEHVRLTHEELQLDQRFSKQAEKQKALGVSEVRKQLGWEEEHCQIALDKLQNWFKNPLESDKITVVGISTEHTVSTYCLPLLTEPSVAQLTQQSCSPELDKGGPMEQSESSAEPTEDSKIHVEEEEVLRPRVARPTGIKLSDRQIERLQKAAEKAEQARAKIEKRKKEWDQLFSEKPEENCEDPRDVQDICEAKDNIGDLKLKSAKDFTVPKYLRVNSERKRAEMITLEEKIRNKQAEMNEQIVTLRDSKACLVSEIRIQLQQLRRIQELLPCHHHRPLPTPPAIRPEETPEKWHYSRATLKQYQVLRQHSCASMEQKGDVSFLEELEAEMEEEQENVVEKRAMKWPASLSALSIHDEEETAADEGVELSELEEELLKEKEVKLLHFQDLLLEEIESSVYRFDAKLLLLRHQKLFLDWQLKLADLRLLTLYQELLLLKEVDIKEGNLQERLSACEREEDSITSKLDECNKQLEVKWRDVTKLQEREKSLAVAFQDSLGEHNKFEDLLTKVFKMKIKRVKKKEQAENEEVKEDSGDSDEYDDWDDDDDDNDTEMGGTDVDDRECPPGCDLDLFESVVQLRERRLDLEEMLIEEKKSVEALEKECETLMKKKKLVKSNRKAAEEEVELANREKQQKMNDLDVVVPLRLHQIELITNGSVPSDLSPALVLPRTELDWLQDRVTQLHVEKSQQKDVCCQVRQQRVRLVHDRKDMKAQTQALEKQCNELMMTRFGRKVNLEALQMQSGNRTLEELKQEKCLQKAAYTKEIKQWDRKVEEAHQDLMEVTRSNTERLLCLTCLLDQKMELEDRLSGRHKKINKRQHQDYSEDILRLQDLVKRQSQQIEALHREIGLLSRQGGSVLPTSQPLLPPIAPLPKKKTFKSLCSS